MLVGIESHFAKKSPPRINRDQCVAICKKKSFLISLGHLYGYAAIARSKFEDLYWHVLNTRLVVYGPAGRPR
jgi:hypothetical protein